MKKLLLLLSCSFSLWANPQIVSLNDVTEELIEQFKKGQIQSLIIECTEDTKLPLDLQLTGTVVSLTGTESSQLTLRILKTFYLKFEEDSLSASSDLKTWRDITEFLTGNIHALFQSESSNPKVILGAEVHERQD